MTAFEAAELLAAYIRHRGFPYPDPVDLLDSARDLAGAAGILHWASELECNGVERFDPAAGCMAATWTDKDQARVDRRVFNAAGKAQAALDRLFGRGELVAEAQDDPRGAALHVLDGDTLMPVMRF